MRTFPKRPFCGFAVFYEIQNLIGYCRSPLKHLKIMRKTQSILFLTLCLLLGLSSCTFNNVEEDLLPPVDVDPCDSIPATFATDIVPIIESSCSGAGLGQCHQAGSPRGDFTTYSGLKLDVDNGKFNSRVLEVKDMPAGFSNGPRSLTPAQLQTIQCWIDAGAPDN